MTDETRYQNRLLDEEDDWEFGEEYAFYSEGTVRVAALAGENYLSSAEADARLEEWRQAAMAEDKGRNCDKTILSLFDESGVWSTPFVLAGYNVIQIDIQNGVDINDFCAEYLFDNGIDEAWGVLAAIPCTDFAASGARWWKDKDADGRTAASIELGNQALRTVEFFKPEFWAAENPSGRIEKMLGLPKPHLIFDPCHYGDPYTKKTMIYGKFNADLPLAPVAPVEGSLIHKLRGDVPEQKKLRSLTPEGFSFAFFMANSFQQQELRMREENKTTACRHRPAA